MTKLTLSLPVCTLKRAAIDVGKRTVTLAFEATLTPDIIKAERLIWQLTADRLLILTVETIQQGFDLAEEEPPTPQAEAEEEESQP